MSEEYVTNELKHSILEFCLVPGSRFPPLANHDSFHFKSLNSSNFYDNYAL